MLPTDHDAAELAAGQDHVAARSTPDARTVRELNERGRGIALEAAAEAPGWGPTFAMLAATFEGDL